MTQRPLTVPLSHPHAQFRRFCRLVTRRQVPHHHHTLQRPHPRRQLLHTLLTPMLRRLNVQHLFARPKQNFNRPSPGELADHPRQRGLQVRREQVAITHPTRRVTHHHHLDRAVAQHRWPHHLVAQRLQRTHAAIDRHLHVLPHPRPARRPLAVRLRRRFLRFRQPRTLLGFLATLAFL